MVQRRTGNTGNDYSRCHCRIDPECVLSHSHVNPPVQQMDIIERLRTIAREATIRSVPKLLQQAKSEGRVATKKQAEEALAQRVPAQVLHPPPRSLGKTFSESPETRYACDLVDFNQNTNRPGYVLVMMQTWSRRIWAAQ